MTTVSPTDHEIRKHGALVAAAICLAWIVGGGIGWVFLLPVNSAFAAVPALVALGGLAALPGFTFLGWHYAPRAAATRDAFLPMVALVVLISDLVVVVVMAAISTIVAVNDHVESDLVALVVSAVLNVAQVAVAAVVVYFIGLLIFGLPGLLLAVPSSWYWEHLMRRNVTLPGNGEAS